MNLLLNMFFRPPNGPGRLADGGFTPEFPDLGGTDPETPDFFEKTL